MPGLMLALALLAPGAQADDGIEIQVAARDLPPGTTLRYADFETRGISPSYVPNGVLRSPAEALGRTTREWVYRGEALRPERLDEVDGPNGLLASLPRGMKLHELVLPAPQGWPRAGDWVDLAHPEQSCLLASSVAVLGTRIADAPIDTARSPGNVERVYVALSAAQVPVLLDAGQPRLLLRGPHDLAPPTLPLCEVP